MTTSDTHYRYTTTTPQDHPAKLTHWWARGSTDLRFYCYKVLVVRRDFQEDTTGIKEHILSIKFAGKGSTGEEQVHDVDLIRHHAHVFGDFPSTAQLVRNPGVEPSYGFLFIDPQWFRARGLDPELYREGGGKWPLSAEQTGLQKVLMRLMEMLVRITKRVRKYARRAISRLKEALR